jgi:NAD(P)-dependent dehydrogenase (short-subunit alcohol dehydrogenase family)
VASFDPETAKSFGTKTPLGRAGQPEEVAPAYVYLASRDSSYITGQTIHVNGGSVVNA